MIDWSEAVEWYFLGWFGADNVPHEFVRALDHSVGREAELHFIYPVGKTDGPRASFLALTDREPLLVHFDSPATTVVSFVGSLVGGVYSETLRLDDAQVVEPVCEFSHERLGPDSPLRASFKDVEPRGTGDLARWKHSEGQRHAWSTFQLLRETLRSWSIDPRQQPPAA